MQPAASLMMKVGLGAQRRCCDSCLQLCRGPAAKQAAMPPYTARLGCFLHYCCSCRCAGMLLGMPLPGQNALLCG